MRLALLLAVVLVTAFHADATATAGPRIAAGGAHTLVLDGFGRVWSWGENTKGQLGDGTSTNRLSPVAVGVVVDIVAVGATYWSSVALAGDGTVWAWGHNGFGQLGDGTTVSQSAPVQVLGLTDVVAVAAGIHHVLALKNDGTVWSWGYNATGQLGDGTTENRSLAAPVTGVASAVAIAAGGGHSMALLADGTILAWGSNVHGQLGVGSFTDSGSPLPVADLDDVVSIAGGVVHSLALRRDGSVWAWGWNSSGQLGDSTFLTRNSPVLTTGLTEVRRIVAGYYHNFALGADGTFWTWGQNLKGQLGDGTSDIGRSSPVSLPGLADVVDVAGASHSLALTSNDTLWGWGFNSAGQVGDGTTIDRRTPVQVSGPGLEWMTGTPILDPITGTYDSPLEVQLLCSTPDAAIHYTTNGLEPTESDPAVVSGAVVLIERSVTLKARAFSPDLLPSNVTAESYTFQAAPPSISPAGGLFTTPQVVSIATSTPDASVHYTSDGSEPTLSSPRYTAPLIIDRGTVLTAKAFREGWLESDAAVATYSFDFGVLEPPAFNPPGGIFESSVVVELTAAPGATIHYTTDGSDPTTASSLYVDPIEILSPTTLKAAAFHPDASPSPVATAVYELQVARPEFHPAAGIYVHAVEVSVQTGTEGAEIRFTTDGSEPTEASDLYVGPIEVSQNTTLKAKAFRLGWVESVTADATYRILGAALAAGGRHSLALDGEGQVWAWGDNGDGQLGDGTTFPRPIPDRVSGLADIVAIAAGSDHSLALAGNGTVSAWGGNGSGQLGDGTNESRSLPILVSGLSDVVAVAAGSGYSLALLSDGTVRAWGANDSGQLGDGTLDTSSSPVQVVGLSEVTAIAAGESHSLALKFDGTVWAWGKNELGQLGNGTTDDSALPVPSEAFGNVLRIAAGARHSIAVTGEGTVWSWGDNSHGQLGDGTSDFTPLSTFPVQVLREDCGGGGEGEEAAFGECGGTPFTGAVAVAAGGEHSLVLGDDGSVWAWGENESGQLGDGSSIDRDFAAPVTGLAQVVLITAGGTHNLALDSDLAVWGWGDNLHGQVGDGTADDHRTPVKISEANLDWKVGTPVFSLAPGEYHEELQLVMTTATPGALIHFTTDGSEVTEGAEAIPSGGSVAVDRSMTIRAIAFNAGQPQSNERMGTFSLVVFPPVLTPPPGSYDAPVTVTVTGSTPGAALHYTTNGLEPQPTDPEIVSGATLLVDTDVFLWVSAFRDGWQSASASGLYRMAVLTPAFAPPPGTYREVQQVTISVATAGAVVHYTTDGSFPTPDAPVARPGQPIVVGRTTTIKAMGYRGDLSASDLVEGLYTLHAETPVMTPAEATGGGPEHVVLSTTTEGATIRYTIDGASPDATSPVYTTPILIDSPRTLRASAFKAMWVPSDVAEAFYDIGLGEVAAPQLTPAPGSYTTTQQVVITCETPGAIIRLTTSGLDPTENDPVIPSGAPVVVNRSTVLKVKAWKDGLGESAVRSGTYLVTGAVTAGANFTLALKSDGSVWAWGANGAGQVGNGETAPSVATPVQVLLPVPAVAVAGGGSHSLAIDRDGAVWAWGANHAGQLGNGTTDASATPVMVEGLSEIAAIAAGGAHNLALARNGTVWAWGENDRGRVGDGTTTDRLSPVRVLDIDRLGVVGIAAGNGHSLAWTRTGSVFAWGVNFNGQLGPPPDIADHPRPIQVPVLALAGVAGGNFHSLGLETGGASAGRLWHWGSPPTVYPDPDDVIRLASGGRNILVKSDGSAWTSRSPLPQTLDLALGPENVVGVSAGQGHFIAVSSEGTIWTWGTNAFGELGDGTRDAKVHPAPVPGLRLVENIAVGEDPDGDWLSDAEEYRLGTDPRNPDTNGDGIIDGLAVALGLSPTHPDMDGDGVGNAAEMARGTDPFERDTDGDGFVDGADCFPLDATQNECLVDDPLDETPPGITILVPRGLTLLSSSP